MSAPPIELRPRKRRPRPAHATPPVRCLTVMEAAERLRFGRTKMYALIQRGDIPSVRINRSVRIPEEWLRDYIEQNKEYGR